MLGVDPAAKGRGLGAALTLAGLRYLRGRGLTQAMLYVDESNHRAVALYQRLGFVRWATDVCVPDRQLTAADRRLSPAKSDVRARSSGSSRKRKLRSDEPSTFTYRTLFTLRSLRSRMRGNLPLLTSPSSRRPQSTSTWMFTPTEGNST